MRLHLFPLLLLLAIGASMLAACSSPTVAATPLLAQVQFQVGGMEQGPTGGT